MATKQQKRNGKTVGVYIDEYDYDTYSRLGLRDRKRVLEAAREALLDALGKAKDRSTPVVEAVQSVPVVPAVPEAEPEPAGNEAPTVCETPMAEEKPAADTPDTGLRGFLDAGW
jgi:hypothetical protein